MHTAPPAPNVATTLHAGQPRRCKRSPHGRPIRAAMEVAAVDRGAAAHLRAGCAARRVRRARIRRVRRVRRASLSLSLSPSRAGCKEFAPLSPASVAQLVVRDATRVFVRSSSRTIDCRPASKKTDVIWSSTGAWKMAIAAAYAIGDDLRRSSTHKRERKCAHARRINSTQPYYGPQTQEERASLDARIGWAHLPH